MISPEGADRPRVCALQRPTEEAAEWFGRARTALGALEARPLRAIVDYDEALVYARRGGSADAARARPRLDAALGQFRALGMPGWIRRAEALAAQLANARDAAAAAPPSAKPSENR